MRLYNYFRSSASFRVRIALNLKGLPFDYLPVHLLKAGGEQFAPEYRAMSADALVPVLIDDEPTPAVTLTQSLAIVEYLEETHPEPAILPHTPAERARVRALALSIACEIHPLNNLRVLRYLVKTLGIAEEAKNAWYRHWVESGLAAIEIQLAHSPMTRLYCHGDTPTLADICLVPQIFNGRRVDCDFKSMPTVMRVFDACMEHDAFRDAAPSLQPDAE